MTTTTPRGQTTVARSAMEVLAAHGTEIVFGIPGVHNQGLYDALIDLPGVRSVVTRHEQGAAFMADGYARSTGRVGVCLLITGPGLTNAATAIGEAYADSVPMLCVVTRYAETPSRRGRRLHDLKDQSALLAGLFKASFAASTSDEVADVVTEALAAATGGRPGPVALELPLELLDRPATSRASATPTAAPTRVRAVDDGAARRALAEAERPVVVVGGGASDASAAVTAFVDRLQAPVLLTAAGKGVVAADHPLVVGAWLKSAPVQALVSAARPLVLIGSEWSTTDLGEAPFEAPKAFVRVDIDEHAAALPGITVRADSEIVGSWAAELPGRTAPGAAAEVDRLRRAASTEPRRWPDAVLRYLERLRAVLSRDAIVAHDMNTLSYAAVERFDVHVPRSFLFPRGYGTLGYALPAAIGARLANPDRQVAAVAGDGGFLFTAEELATAVRYGLSLPVVIWNNRSFGAIRATRTAAYGRSVDDDLVNPDFVGLAEAFGCKGVRVADPGAFGLALEEALEHRGPTVIEIDAPR